MNSAKRFVVLLESQEFLIVDGDDHNAILDSTPDLWSASIFTEENLPSIAKNELLYLDDKDVEVKVVSLREVVLSLN